MKRKGFVATIRNEHGRSVEAFSDATVEGVLKQAASNGKVNTIITRFSIEMEPFEWEEERCEMCNLTLGMCNCSLIEPDPPTHRVLSFGIH